MASLKNPYDKRLSDRFDNKWGAREEEYQKWFDGGKIFSESVQPEQIIAQTIAQGSNSIPGEIVEVSAAFTYDSIVLRLRKEVLSITFYSSAGVIISTHTPQVTNGYQIILDDTVPKGVYFYEIRFKDLNIKSFASKFVKIDVNLAFLLRRIFPKVTTFIFRSVAGQAFSADNRAPSLPNRTLGLFASGTEGVHFVCEKRFNIDMQGYSFADFEIVIKRKRTTLHEYFASSEWRPEPAEGQNGTFDDSPTSATMHLVKDYNDPHIYDFDGPGFDNVGQVFSYWQNTLNATKFVFSTNFMEWVQLKETSTGIVIDDPTVMNWFCKIFFDKVAENNWQASQTASSSGIGHIPLGH